MEFLSGAVIGELVARSVSFLLGRHEEPRATVQEDLRRLQLLLLRGGAIVEEAERRRVTNRAMLRQLELLRSQTFRGHHVLDAVRCRFLLAGGARRGGRRHDGGTNDDDDDDEESRRAFAVSRFNPAKRVRFPSGGAPEAEVAVAAPPGGASQEEVQQMVGTLEETIGDMEEFVVLLMSYPPFYRQPFSAHLFLDRSMFGRHMETERVMEFLLQPEPPGAGAAASLDVLPITGPELIGKSTLVEHVIADERVRGHFSLILVYSGSELRGETLASFRDGCVTKHHSAADERFLIVVELTGDVDDDTWNHLVHSSGRALPRGSKAIVTSRCETVARLGTAPPLRLTRLPAAAFWYFFKTLVFGGDDPAQHPAMASIALQMARGMQGSLVYALVAAELMRVNFSAGSWSRILTNLIRYQQKNGKMLGQECPEELKGRENPHFFWSILKEPDKYHILYNISPRGPAMEETPEISLLDVLYGRARPEGKYELLFWKSRIPPYFSYTSTCITCDM
ncbi:hypothetical protein ACP4OV_020292 [Aristida adscensionis]